MSSQVIQFPPMQKMRALLTSEGFDPVKMNAHFPLFFRVAGTEVKVVAFKRRLVTAIKQAVRIFAEADEFAILSRPALEQMAADLAVAYCNAILSESIVATKIGKYIEKTTELAHDLPPSN